jgi:hypothetical protein
MKKEKIFREMPLFLKIDSTTIKLNKSNSDTSIGFSSDYSRTAKTLNN